MSALSDSIGRYIPILGSRKPKIDKKDALAIVPVRNPLVEWERKENEVVLNVPLRDDRLGRFLKWVLVHSKFGGKLPEHRQIGLDEVGASVWQLCDGNRDINAIVLAVSKSYKLTRREAEASVTMFLQTLAKRNLIGLMSAGGTKNSVKSKRN